MNGMRLFLEATRIASAAHARQRRSSGEPYFTHCLSVTTRVHDALAAAFEMDSNEACDLWMMLPPGRETPPDTVPVVCDYWTLMSAAILHDVREDQPDWDDSVRSLHPGVAALCEQLRNFSCDMPPDTPKPEKKFADLRHIDATMGPFAAVVKACDRIDNCLSAAVTWDAKRRADYAGWSDELHRILRTKLKDCPVRELRAAWEHLDPQLAAAIKKMRQGV